jgi:hypothetical protein
MSPDQAVSSLFDLLEKAAAEADGLEMVVKRQASEIESLKKAQKAASTGPVSRPFLDPAALSKLAGVLEDENLLPEGMTAKEASDNILINPNILIRWMTNLAAPSTVAEGRAVKSATADAPPPISGDGKLVKIGSNIVVDHDGWAEALK